MKKRFVINAIPITTPINKCNTQSLNMIAGSRQYCRKPRRANQQTCTSQFAPPCANVDVIDGDRDGFAVVAAAADDGDDNGDTEGDAATNGDDDDDDDDGEIPATAPASCWLFTPAAPAAPAETPAETPAAVALAASRVCHWSTIYLATSRAVVCESGERRDF